jgi:hypothetical protein
MTMMVMITGSLNACATRPVYVINCANGTAENFSKSLKNSMTCLNRAASKNVIAQMRM